MYNMRTILSCTRERKAFDVSIGRRCVVDL